jgi:predicted ATPase/DNA-binding winged helix-turn-helix (wHTH) protein
MDRDPAQRRSAPTAPARTAYRFDAFELRPGQLLRGGNPVPLGSTALEVLRQLLRARGDLVTKDDLFGTVWTDVVVVENTLHQHIRALRKALGDRGELVETIARRGYRFAGAVEEVALTPVDARWGRRRQAALALPLTPLVGRLETLAAIEELLASSRCVTLLGPGGAGKTRLAFEIARRRDDAAQGGTEVHVVELAAIVHGEHVAAAVAEAVGPPDPSGAPTLTKLRHALRDADVWIVLDNCEHLIDATAALASDLLQACPALRILATSQRPLGIAGEQRFHVPMLRLPPPGESDPSRIAAATAVQLLVARVGESDPSLVFDGPALATAAELCRQLDANPLAIELAAVRVATLGLRAVQAGLADRFRLLAGPRRGALPKHQTLRSMVEWSHDLLTEAQRATFRRLSVFAGSFTLESAAALASDAKLGRESVAHHLAELVEWSLVGRGPSARAPRFRLLETQRAYALDELRASGELASRSEAHARHVCALFDAGYREWDETPDDEWIDRYGPERDNLRAALRTALDSSDPVLAARLAGASVWLWRATGSVSEFQRVLEDPSLPAGDSLPDEVASRLLLARAYSLHAVSSDSERIRSVASRAVEVFERTRVDAFGAANALLCLASAYAQLGDTGSHRDCLARVEAALDGGSRGKTYAWFCGSHAWAAQLAGEPREALAWAIRSRAAYRDAGGWHGETRALLHIADLKLAVGDVDGAIAAGTESVERLHGGAHRGDLGRALANLGTAWFTRCEPEAARDCWARALHALRGLDFSYWVFDPIALLAIAEGRDADAARLVGHADAGYARFGKGKRVQNEQAARTRATAHLEARFGRDELSTLLLEGAHASEDEAIAWALAPAQGSAPAARAR